MVVKAAGVLPTATYQGQNYFLLGREGSILNQQWSDLGGIRDKGDLSPIITAVRKAYEESRGALGSRLGVFFRLLLTSKTVHVREYRCYLTPLPVSSLTAIPGKFNASPLHGKAFALDDYIYTCFSKNLSYTSG